MQVKDLSAQVEKLSNENGALMSEIQSLRASKAQDQKTMDSLNTLVAKLQSGIGTGIR